MKMYIVSTQDAEGASLHRLSIHRTHAGALQRFHEHRRRLLAEALDGAMDMPGLYGPMVIALSNDDPETLNNYPHDTPVMREIEGEE